MNENENGGAVSHAQNPHILRRARDFYAIYMASCGGLNYQGQPCPEWDDLTPAVRGHWYTVALRAQQLYHLGVDLADEHKCVPNDYVIGHLGPDAKDVWVRYSGLRLPGGQ